MTRVVAVPPSGAWSVEARVLLELLRGLSRHGVGVGVAAARGTAVAQGATSMALPLVEHDAGDAGWLRAGARLAELARANDVDAFLVADAVTQLAAARAVRSTGRGVVLRRLPTGVAQAASTRTRIATRLAPTWFVHGTAADAEASARVPAVRGRVVAPPSVDAAALRSVAPAPTPLGTRTLVLVTDRDARRATSAAIRAVAALRRRGHPWRVHVVGTPHDENEVRVHGTAVGLGDALQLLGEPVDRAPIVAGADVVWVVADHDGGGVAVLEAMALGRPVLVARGTLGERWIDHPLTGLIVERDDALGSAATLALLDEDDAVREALGAAARLDHDAQHLTADPAAALATAIERAVGRARAAA
jgi:hypothetical protein